MPLPAPGLALSPEFQQVALEALAAVLDACAHAGMLGCRKVGSERKRPIVSRPYADPAQVRGRGLSFPRRAAPGICEVSSRAPLRGERSAERRRGLRGPRSRCERPDTLAKRVWVPLRSGTRAFRRSTTAFSWGLAPHASGRRLPPGSQPVDRWSSRLPAHGSYMPIERCPRRPGMGSSRLSRTRRHTVPASAKSGAIRTGAPQQAGWGIIP